MTHAANRQAESRRRIHRAHGRGRAARGHRCRDLRAHPSRPSTVPREQAGGTGRQHAQAERTGRHRHGAERRRAAGPEPGHRKQQRRQHHGNRRRSRIDPRGHGARAARRTHQPGRRPQPVRNRPGSPRTGRQAGPRTVPGTEHRRQRPALDRNPGRRRRLPGTRRRDRPREALGRKVRPAGHRDRRSSGSRRRPDRRAGEIELGVPPDRAGSNGAPDRLDRRRRSDRQRRLHRRERAARIRRPRRPGSDDRSRNSGPERIHRRRTLAHPTATA